MSMIFPGIFQYIPKISPTVSHKIFPASGPEGTGTAHVFRPDEILPQPGAQEVGMSSVDFCAEDEQIGVDYPLVMTNIAMENHHF